MRKLALTIGLIAVAVAGAFALALPSTAHPLRPGDPFYSHGKYIGKFLSYVRPANDPIQYCDDSGECFNSWNGGPAVKTYTAGVTNDSFEAIQISICNNGFTSTNCPISGNPIDRPIVALFAEAGNYQGNNIGDQNNDPNVGYAYEIVSGGWGSTTVQDAVGCPTNEAAFIDAHWSSNWAHAKGLGYGGSGNGKQWVVNTSTILCMKESAF